MINFNWIFESRKMRIRIRIKNENQEACAYHQKNQKSK